MATKRPEYKQLKEAELRKELSSLTKTANRRLASLEKQGVKTFSYGTAKNYAKTQGRSAKKPRFASESQIQKMSYNEMQNEYSQVVKFMKAETSTVSGMEKAVQNMAAAFEGQFDTKGLNKRQLNRVYQTLSSGLWRDIQEAYGAVASADVIESIIEGAKKGMTIKEIKSVLLSIQDDLDDPELDWADFDRRFTRDYAQIFGKYYL